MKQAKDCNVKSGNLFILFNTKPPGDDEFILSLKLLEYSDGNSSKFLVSSFLEDIHEDSQLINKDFIHFSTLSEFHGAMNEENSHTYWEIYSPTCKIPHAFSTTFKLVDLGFVTLVKSISVEELKNYLIYFLPAFAGLQANNIRIWSTSRILKEPDSLILANCPSLNTKLTIQVIEHDEMPFFTKNLNCFCIYIYVRDSKNQKFHRPLEYYYNPSYSLLDCLIKDLNIPDEFLLAAKYVSYNSTWAPLGNNPFVQGVPPFGSSSDSSYKVSPHVGELISSVSPSTYKSPISPDSFTTGPNKTNIKDGGLH